ncbi:MAG: hypothetical protein KatS3mg087_1418 [Patescibacteria group bacterium]|nr:MAG: hypothetical protein KatS3mg087_1418 [Patescibacteria group bacterium]
MTEVHLANFRLAKTHHHAWADLRILPFFDENGEADLESLENYYFEVLDDPDYPGVHPSPEHKTRSGRVSWKYDNKQITISIHRPGEVVGAIDGDLVVLEVWASLNSDGTICSIDYLERCRLAEPRHWSALLYCLETLGLDLLEGETLWEDIVYNITKEIPISKHEWPKVYEEAVKKELIYEPKFLLLAFEENWYPVDHLVCPECGMYYPPRKFRRRSMCLLLQHEVSFSVCF